MKLKTKYKIEAESPEIVTKAGYYPWTFFIFRQKGGAKWIGQDGVSGDPYS